MIQLIPLSGFRQDYKLFIHEVRLCTCYMHLVLVLKISMAQWQAPNAPPPPPPPPLPSLQPWWKSHTSFDRNTIHLVRPISIYITHENCILPPLLQTHLKSKLKQLKLSQPLCMY